MRQILTEAPMSAMGQQRTLRCASPMSARGQKRAFDHVVSTDEQYRRDFETERPGGPQMITKSNLAGCTTGNSLQELAARTSSDLDQCLAIRTLDNFYMKWKLIHSAPFDQDLELAVIDYDGTHILVFPCRRILNGWINAETKERMLGLLPTHWREWQVSGD